MSVARAALRERLEDSAAARQQRQAAEELRYALAVFVGLVVWNYVEMLASLGEFFDFRVDFASESAISSLCSSMHS